VETVRGIGHFTSFCGQVGLRVFTGRFSLHDLIRHLAQVLTRCFLPVAAMVFPFGMVIALQGLSIFETYGAQRLLASLASVAIIRELSPVLASVLVAAQGGSACAAELGAMRIKEELDATEVMGIDSLSVHVVPRVLAMTIACPVLNLFGTVSGLVGAFVTAVVLKGENGGVFLAQLFSFTMPFDLIAAGIKTTVFGIIIGLVSAYMGFHTTGGAAGVGRAVNQTVVRSTLLFITANYFLTSALFGTIS
jgi:phospholipid/cholesterol/gamma-HCH transport system permease protein